MEYANYEQLQERIQALYAAGAYNEAGGLAAQGSAWFPEKKALLLYWQIAMAARIGDTQQALARLDEALRAGFWYSEVLLRVSPNMKALQGLAEFEMLVEKNRQIRAADEARIYPMLVVRPQGRCASGGPACPVMIALHRAGSTAQASIELWRPAASAGWLTAVLQSSQAMWKGAYGWDDRQIAQQDAQHHRAVLEESYAVDKDQIVVAGLAEGADMAIWLALTGGLPVNGLVAVTPQGILERDPESLESLLKNEAVQEKLPHLRAAFILSHGRTPNGSGNRAGHAKRHTNESGRGSEAMVARLQEAGLSCHVEYLERADFAQTPGYIQALNRSLAFIQERNEQ